MNKMPHIQLDGSVNATAAILPGDPARVDAIATFLTDVKEEGFSREYKSITGTYKGHRILAISTGMGGASTAICVEELADLGFQDLIRIGSCGALQSHLQLGQLVLCDRAVCDDGTSQTYTNYLRYAAPELNLPSSSLTANSVFPAPTASLFDKTATSPESAIQFAFSNPNLLTICEAQAKKLEFPYARPAAMMPFISEINQHWTSFIPAKEFMPLIWKQPLCSPSVRLEDFIPPAF